MTTAGNGSKREDTLERLYGELEKKWKTAQETKTKKRLEAGKLPSKQEVKQPDIMDEETFNTLFGGLSKVEEAPRALPDTTSMPVIPFGEEEAYQEKDTEEELKVDDVVSVKINLPFDNIDTKLIVLGKIARSPSQLNEPKVIIKYLGGLTREEERIAVQNNFIRKGYMKVGIHSVTPYEKGYGESRFIESETGIHPFNTLEVRGRQGFFRAIGVGKNSSPDKKTIIVISEEALKRAPQLEDELEVLVSDVSKSTKK